MIRVGLVGLGGIAGIHILAYKQLENVKIVAACDSQGREAKSYPLIRDEEVAIYSDLTEMLDSEELDMIEAYNTAKSEMTKGKSAAKRTAAEEQVKAMTETIAPLYIKAMEYLKENAFDLEKECGYQEWDEATTARVNRYLDAVIRMEDPKIPTATTAAEPAQSEMPTPDEIRDPMMDMVAGNDGVPF